MNTKVTQMIELLFRDVQPSEEVQALREEVLNNCQERFEDLTRSGLSEEEALAAVMESLKGMEDVLKEYPRKEKEQEPALQAAEKKSTEDRPSDEPERMSFSAGSVKAVQAQLTSCRVEVAQGGEEVSVETRGPVHCDLESDGTLRIWQERATENLFKGIAWGDSVSSFEHFGDALNRLAQNLTQMISGKIGEISGNQEISVVLRLPEKVHPEVTIRTMSGDVSWQDAAPGRSFTLGTTSGDIRVRLDQDLLLQEAEITSTSGDAELKMSAETARITTVSGDITWDGDAGVLDMNSTSGDASAAGKIRMANLKSTSGDLNLVLADDLPAEVKANTVSGDIHLRLTGERGAAQARLKTVSGEIRTHSVDLSEEAPVRIDANTVSGSLRISR